MGIFRSKVELVFGLTLVGSNITSVRLNNSHFVTYLDTYHMYHIIDSILRPPEFDVPMISKIINIYVLSLHLNLCLYF